MKGVDLLDQMDTTRSSIGLQSGGVGFFYFLTVACYNAFVAARSAGGADWKYRRGGYKDWLEDLTMELIVPVTKRSAPQVLPTSPIGASAEHDLVQLNTKRKTCRECSLKHSGTDVRPGSTLMGCRQCDLPLHRECFTHHVLRHERWCAHARVRACVLHERWCARARACVCVQKGGM